MSRSSIALLDSLERSSLLTRQGRDWLITAIDPFHDTDVKPTGYPDVDVQGSVCQLIKQQFTIKCPASITSGTWDVNIFNLPWWNASAQNQFAMSSGMVAQTSSLSSTPLTSGGIMAIAVPTGQDTYTGNAAATVSSMAIDTRYTDGPSRVVAAGFEVTNTTADIYKQGAVTVYRQAQYGADPFIINFSSAASAPYTTQTALAARQVARQPIALTEATRLLGSRTWDAREGAYCVLTQTGINNPMLSSNPYGLVHVISTGNSGVFSETWGGNITGSTSLGVPFISKSITSPHNMSGAYFTGLSLQTSLTISMNVYIERFPTSAQLDLSVLAEPGPSFDPVAMELYCHAMSRMPVGVMVKENGLGSWFRNVIKEVSPYVSSVLGAIPHPYAKAAAFAADAAGSWATKAQEKHKAKKAAKKGLQKAPPGGKGDGLKRKPLPPIPKH